MEKNIFVKIAFNKKTMKCRVVRVSINNIESKDRDTFVFNQNNLKSCIEWLSGFGLNNDEIRELGSKLYIEFETKLKELIERLKHIDVLERFKKYIVDGGEFWAFDSEEIGNKDTQTSWGLCCRVKEMWKDSGKRTRKANPIYLKLTSGRREAEVVKLETVYVENPGNCPMDRRGMDGPSWGCFYHCRIFNPEKGGKPNRGEAIKLYDLGIEKLKEKL